MASVVCPQNQNQWKERSKHCVSNEQSYHCVRDEYGNYVDACVGPIWIQPDSACTMNSQQRPTSIADSVAMNNQSTTTVPRSLEESTSCGPACMGIAVAVPIVVILLVVAVVFFIIRRRAASRGENKESLPRIFQRLTKDKKQEDTHIQLENEEQGKKLLENKLGEPDMIKPDDNNPFSDDMMDEDIEENTPWNHFLKSLNLKVDKLYKPPGAENLGTRLRSLEALSIVGKWGSGKTTLAKQAILDCALNFVSSTCTFTTVHNISDWKKGLHDNCTCFIYLQDCIKEWYSPGHVEELAKGLTDLFINARGKCFVILSVRDTVWEKYEHVLSQCDILKDTRRHLMQDKEILSSKDYREMLHKQLQANNAKVDMSENIPVDDKCKEAALSSRKVELLVAKEKGVLGLPEMIALSCKNRRILVNVERFCAEPFSVIKEDLKQMSESPKVSEKYKFVVLSYAMIHNGSFSLSTLNQHLLRSIRTIFAVFSPPDDYFEEAAEKLLDDYLELSVDKETYYIQHEIISRIIFEIIAESRMEFLIQNCDSKLLFNCIRPATFSFTSIFGKLNKELVVGIEPSQHQALCARFKEPENGCESEVRKHVIMEDAGFQRLMMS
ncbi:uncharacterized protein LOC125646427 isoform X2 [Ostrea edulis]|uniref:uncharacterized protein LOC125646427 isoform X2 n=1 Tax=Ostrea edulis TaxID=37623 RepID=UPI0020959A1B|nr:uncharacterized protein LOC125646427 isoform X2 [Ostrea edulis]